MKSLMTSWSFRTATAAVAISLGACQQSPRSAAVAGADQNVRDKSLPTADYQAAVEPFEILTEQAFTANPNQLRTLVSNAKSSYRTVESGLAPPQRAGANQHLTALTKADRQGDRAGMALASVELYRLLLEVQNRAGDPAIRAGLLDYAGFRYNALAQARQIDWAEMSRTTRSAQIEWRRLEPSIADKSLRQRFSNSLKAMSDAATKRDKASARKAASIELQLVDLLEKQAAANSG